MELGVEKAGSRVEWLRLESLMTSILFFGGLLVMAGSVAIHLFLFRWVHVPVHSVVEILGALAAISLALLIQLLRKYEKTLDHHVWILSALVSMGILDAFHASVLPGASFVWLHSTATLIGGLLFALVCLPARLAQSRVANRLPVVMAVAVSLFGLLSAAFPTALPAMATDNGFTPAANAINLLGGLFFSAAALRFLARYRREKGFEDLLFASLCLLFGLAGFWFPFSHLWSSQWWFWHLLRLVAYLIVLSYVLVMFRRSEEELHRINRALKMTRRCNQAVIRGTEEPQLLRNICRIIREVGGFCMAWVGLAEAGKEKTVRLAAHAGCSDEYLEAIRVASTNTPRSGNPAHTAIETGKPSLVKNILLDPPFLTWRTEAIKYGYDSLIALPLIANGQSLGALNIYAREPDAFDEEEVKLLAEQANDLAYGLAALRTRADRQRAEEELRRQFDRISLLNEIARAIAERLDLRSIFRVVLQRLVRHLSMDLGAVYLYDAQEEALTAMVHEPEDHPILKELGMLEGAVLRAGQSPFQACVSGRTAYVPDTAEGGEEFLLQLARAGLRSLIAVPLAIEDRLLGVLVGLRRTVGGFGREEREFLCMASEHVALAAHQAQLYADLQRAYDELRQTREAVMQQERLRALGQMASGIVHDINNALSPIVGFAELLLTTEKNLSERMRGYLQDIRTSAMDISHIASQMREFYRKRDKKEPLLAINLNDVVKQVVDLTSPRWKDIPQRQGVTIRIDTELAPDLPVMAGIESEIREALINLILNAVDAMPGGGSITIRTQAENDGASAIPYVVLSVRDTGLGMSEEERARCLEPFYTTKGEQGTGLGLAMVYGVMQRHDGDIDIESERGRGTAIHLRFPLRSPAGTTVLSNLGAPQSLGPLKILCIDDEPLLRRLLKEMLIKEDHVVEVADGGQAGLDAFRAAREQDAPFDAVITDLGMPFMDGRQVAYGIKQESPTTPVILLTGWGKRMKADGQLPQQVDYVLSKPPKMDDLRQALVRVCRVEIKKAREGEP